MQRMSHQSCAGVMVYDDHQYLDGPNGLETDTHSPHCWCMTDRDRERLREEEADVAFTETLAASDQEGHDLS